MASEKMQRVSKQKPCLICGKPDWCLIAEDGSAAICQRITEGSVKKCGDAGYLHILENRHNGRNRHKCRVNKILLVTNVSTVNSRSRDFGQLAEQYKQLLTDDRLSSLATVLGVSAASLNRLNVGWDGEAHTFPMSNDFGNVIGIQRRFPNGRKVSVNGSKTGLFIPSDLPAESTLLICEGSSDTATALDLGYAALGRPSCNSKVEMTANFARGRAVIVVSDNDSVGRTGSKRLAWILSLSCPSVKIIYPPKGIKDLRQWIKAGLSKEILQELIQKIKPIEIRVSFKD